MAVVEFKESDAEIILKMRTEVIKVLNIKLQKTVKPITLLVKSELARSISEQKEYNSVISGKLRHEFGIPDGISRLSQILDIWVDSVIVVVKSHGALANPMMTIEIRAVEATYSDVLSSDAASFITPENTFLLEWLSWLLVEGSNPSIVADYHVESGRGRAGPLIMRRGGQWGVPTEFQGTESNNFVIRAIRQMEPVLETNIISIIQKAVNV